MPTDQELRTQAEAYLQADDRTSLSALVRQHPGVLDLRTDDSDELPLIHRAAEQGNVRQVQMLLDVGANPAERSGELVEDDPPGEGFYQPGWTAMMLAARYGHTSVIKLLIEHGASVADTAIHDDTAVLFAAIGNHTEALNLLLAQGAPADVVCGVKQFNEDVLGWHFIGTPMHAAASSNSAEAIRTLLGHGVPFETRLCPCGRTPLYYAAAHGSVEAVDVLLRAGADANARRHPNEYDCSPDSTVLHEAARHGHTAVVKLLLEAGADPYAVLSDTDETPLDLAAEEGHDDTCRLLADYCTQRQ